MTDGIVQVCCEMLYEVYILNGIPENKWPDLHQRVAKQVGFEEYLRLKDEEFKAEAKRSGE